MPITVGQERLPLQPLLINSVTTKNVSHKNENNYVLAEAAMKRVII